MFICVSTLSLAQNKKLNVKAVIYLTGLTTASNFSTLQSLADRFKKVVIVYNNIQYQPKGPLYINNPVFYGDSCIATSSEIIDKLRKFNTDYIFSVNKIPSNNISALNIFFNLNDLSVNIANSKKKKISIAYNVCKEKVIRRESTICLDSSYFSSPSYNSLSKKILEATLACKELNGAAYDKLFYKFEWMNQRKIENYKILIKDSISGDTCINIDVNEIDRNTNKSKWFYKTDGVSSCIFYDYTELRTQLTECINNPQINPMSVSAHYRTFYFLVGYNQDNKFCSTPWSKFQIVCDVSNSELPKCECKCKCQ